MEPTVLTAALVMIAVNFSSREGVAPTTLELSTQPAELASKGPQLQDQGLYEKGGPTPWDQGFSVSYSLALVGLLLLELQGPVLLPSSNAECVSPSAKAVIAEPLPVDSDILCCNLPGFPFLLHC